MKKFIAFIFIFYLMISLYFFDQFEYDFFQYADKLNANILINNYDEKLLMFSDVDYCDILDKFNINVIDKFYIDDRLMIEGYSDMFSKGVKINNMAVNIQMSIFENNILLGIPLIKNSF